MRRSVAASCAALLVFVAAVGAPTALPGQTVYGVLLERGTDTPIDLGLVMLLDLEGDSVGAVLTDSTGAFRLRAPSAGDYHLAATAMGYTPTVSSSVLSLPAGTAITLQFRIESRPIEIEGISVEAMASKIREPALVRNGFVARARQGLGKFVAPWEIEDSPAPTTSDLLMRTGRVTTLYRLGGDVVLMRGSRGYCVPALYLDGVRIDLAYTPIDVVAPKFDVQAIEIYRSSAEAPLQYGGGGGGCGVIVAWTKNQPTQPRVSQADVDDVVEVANSSTGVVTVYVMVSFTTQTLGEVNPNQRRTFTLPEGAGETYAVGPGGSRMTRGVAMRRYKVDRATGKRIR